MSRTGELSASTRAPGQERRRKVTASQESTGDMVGDQQPESALHVAARQLSEEARLYPQLAGLSSARQRAVVIRARRLARRMASTA